MNHTVTETMQQRTSQMIADLETGHHALVKAHPGAGKTGGGDSGMVAVCGHFASADRRIGAAFAQNEQVQDFLQRFVSEFPDLPVTLVPASSSYASMPSWITHAASRPASLRVATNKSSLHQDLDAMESFKNGAPGLYVSTASKLDFVLPDARLRQWVPSGPPTATTPGLTIAAPYEILLLDEAWMCQAASLNATLYRTELIGSFGDPGQIPPFVESGDYRPGERGTIVEPLPDALMQMLAGVRLQSAAVSRRLPPWIAAITSELSAYRQDGSTATLYDATEVDLTVGTCGTGEIGNTLAALNESGVVAHTFAADIPVGAHDPELLTELANVTERMLEGSTTVRTLNDTKELRPQDVAVIVSHTAQLNGVKDLLAARGLEAVQVNTANGIQGQTTTVSIVAHPLSGLAEVDDFHLDTGRLVVGLSRATHGTIVVGRRGIRRVLREAGASRELHPAARDLRHDAIQDHRLLLDALQVSQPVPKYSFSPHPIT